MRLSVILFASVVGALCACKSQTVEKAVACTDPCCSGNPNLIDCGENPEISCVESGDPCTAQAFGCTGGVFFRIPQITFPASCSATDATLEDATTPATDATTGQFGMTDASGPETATPEPDATADGGVDAATEAGVDGATEGGLDASSEASDAPDACGDASCSSQ
jgi:hypothetical protein